MAVKFLSNPKVKDTPISAKKAFLKKKGVLQRCDSYKENLVGLTDEQIEEAIRSAGVQTAMITTVCVIPFIAHCQAHT